MENVTKSAANLHTGDEIEFMDDVHMVTHVEQADTTDGNNVPKVLVYFLGLAYSVEFFSDRLFIYFGNVGEASYYESK